MKRLYLTLLTCDFFGEGASKAGVKSKHDLERL